MRATFYLSLVLLWGALRARMETWSLTITLAVIAGTAFVLALAADATTDAP